jgi:UDP-N-acetylmuramate dehydrogenase
VLRAHSCGLGYRTSHFKTAWQDRYVITQITLQLRAAGTADIGYPELRRRLALREGGSPPPLGAVREAVLDIRRGKSMLLDADDPNRRSAGSFFVNPVLPVQGVRKVQHRARAAGLDDLPVHPTPEGGYKLSAAWLVERAGFPPGFADGPVGLSTRHALALINRGGATAADVLRLAARIRHSVRQRFAVTLEPEPVLVGFSQSVQTLLDGA